jgi:hypothetical protein
MIIFNMPAIIVAIFILIASVPVFILASFFPGLEQDEELLGFIVIAIATVVSGICELAGLRGRLFFIPMWLLGIVFTLFGVGQRFGWTGISVTVGVIAGMIGLLVIVARGGEKDIWDDAPDALAQCQRIADPSKKDFWVHFQKALFIPVFKKCTPTIYYHNYQCLELLENLGLDWPVIDPLRNAYAANTHDDCDIKVEDRHKDEIEKLITEQLAQFEEGNDE